MSHKEISSILQGVNMNTTDTYHLFGNLIRFHTRGEMGYCLVEVKTAPGAGVPPNSHPGDNEVFCILEGTYAFHIDGEERIARSGDVVAIPNGAVHALKNIGESSGRMFVFNVPGRIHTAFFSSLGEPMPVGASDFPPPPNSPPDIPRLIEEARRLGVTIHP
ncbi:cupin domain-containing protein [Sinorhizobium meliloti]|uniref:cupin domain-containing protein n=1 Tax=Rhizobium meliloti TaxID=382 RepID=UPI00037AC6EE|nr:cupin domain-containing protein [Sinorhizobium meliloti]